MNARFAIFQKRRIAPFARIPASNPHRMQPTHKNRKLCRSLIKKICANFAEFLQEKFVIIQIPLFFLGVMSPVL